MDNKRNIAALIVVVGLSMLWLQVVWPWWAKKNNWAIAPTTQPAPSVTAPIGPTPTTATTTSSTNPVATAGLHATGAAAASPSVVLGSTAFDAEFQKDQKSPKNLFPLGLVIAPRGAGVSSVTLNRYRAEYDKPEPYVFQKPYGVDSPLAESMATRSITIDGAATIPLDSLEWKSSQLSPSTANSVAEVSDGATPILRITKSYELRPGSDAATGGYEVLIRYVVENLTSQPHSARIAFNGPTAPKPENTRDVAEVVAGFDKGSATVGVEHKPITSIKAGAPLDVRSMKSDEKLLWSGMASSYFDTIVRATDASGAPLPLAAVNVTLLQQAEKEPPVALAYETGDLAVPANGAASFALNTYFGPKLRGVLNSSYYAVYPLSYDGTLVLSGGCYSACTWAWLINILVMLLQGFHFVLRDWGLAIIGLVLLVRLILHPITKSSQVSMSRMTKLGPEMERLKAKYGEDTEGLKKAQVEFYREQGVAPFLGCLPMFLQMPIWVALWSALQSTFEIRHAPFLRFFGMNLTWIHDLSQPDRLISLQTPLSIFFLHIEGLNILPILMGVVFFINQKYQPQPVALKPEQEQQQKMMKWMSVLMFPLFLYSSPSGLNLYIFTSTLIGIFESKRIRAHIKEKEEREKAGVVIIDGPARGQAAGVKQGGIGNALSGGIAGFFSKLQQLDEEAKRANKGNSGNNRKNR